MNTEIDIVNLGAIDQEPKPLDIDLGSVASAEPIPESYFTEYKGEIYHQRKTPSCGAHAGVYIKNVQDGRNHSPAYLWKRIKQVDPFAPEEGTSMEWIFKTLANRGVCDLALLPNNTDVSLDVYTDASVITPKMDEDALKSRIQANTFGYRWQPTFEDIKRAIYDHKAVMARVEISADWWTPSWAGKDILPLKKKFAGQGGHFVVLTGYDKDTIYGLNEWGQTWGFNGRLQFKEDYLSRITHIGTCFDYIEKSGLIFKRTLKKGMKGDDVTILQKYLRDNGYFPKTQSLTSFFGGITFDAVKAFQKAKGLVVDGIVGPKTLAQMK